MRIIDGWCAALPLNIQWYSRARHREERRNHRLLALTVFVMLVAFALQLGAAVAAVLFHREVQSSVMLTLFAGGIGTLVPVTAAGADARARMTIFWKAGCELQDQLYAFEHAWHGKALADGALAPQFLAAVAEAARLARAIERAERTDFFATIRTPQDLASLAATSLESLRGRRAEAVSAIGAVTAAALRDAQTIHSVTTAATPN